jgi:hypothetical protein
VTAIATASHKLQVKVFAASGEDIPLETFIPVFHDWIKHHRLPELLIDVANYAHVPRGPGVALIGNDGDYFIDETDGRRGLLYSRKREPPPPPQRLPDALRRALQAALLLESDPALGGKLRFRADELLFRINDRLLAPSTEPTFAAVRPALDDLAGKLFAGAPYELALASTPRQLFAVKITTAGKSDLRTLLDRLGGPL